MKVSHMKMKVFYNQIRQKKNINDVNVSLSFLCCQMFKNNININIYFQARESVKVLYHRVKVIW
jgi:hypothetical protein